MLIIDRDEKTRNDRTLSFWSTQPTLFDPLIYRCWQQLRIASDNFEQVTALNTYRYATIRGLDFYQHVRETLAGYPNVTFLHGHIQKFEDLPDESYVYVDGERHRGQWVFDSSFNRATFHPDGCHAMEQHFHGWVIETDSPAFDPHIATLMDFRTEQKGEMRFFYVLPFSENRALVEYVLMSQENGQSAIRAYLENVLKIRDYRILSKEGGISPLSDYPFPRQMGAHHMTIGTPGGRVKPSSGYAFTRIQQDSAAIVKSLLANGHPFDIPADPALYRLYDRLMLEVIQSHGEAIRPIFTAMFRNNPVERIFHLLDESASLREMLLLTISLPPRHFIEAIFRFIRT